jgi:hypothetical protein
MSVHFAEGTSGGGSGKPPAIDLAAFASRAGAIDIGGDDIVELGDDLGLGLLTNPSKVAPSPRTGGGFGRSVNVGGDGGGGGGLPTINLKPVDDLGVVDLDVGGGSADISINRGGGGGDSAPFVINAGGSSGSGSGGGGFDTINFDGAGGAGMSAEEEAREKQKLLTKLRRLDNDGIGGSRMSNSNTLDEIKQEVESRTDSKNLEASIRFQRNALMTFVSGVEMVNDKFGNKLPVKPRLKGWSESVHTNIGDFDDIFEELYDMYKDKAKMHPLLRLVGTLGVSATMYHLTNSMAERSGIPGMGDLLNENPELQRQFAAAMAAKIGGGLGNFMGAASGVGPAPGGGSFGGAGPAPMGMGAPPPPSPPRMGVPGRAPFNASSAAGGEPPRARREMRGPTGVDDILKAFETERLMQNASMGPSIDPGTASIFTPPGPPPSTTGVSVLREGVGGAGDPMSEFLAGGVLDDGGSVGSGSTMNTERRRGRRRAAATPMGATLSLNV